MVRRLATIDDEKFKIIFGLLYQVNDKVDLFKKYCTDELFDCRILSVDEEFRGRGLANILMADTIDVAKRAGFQVFNQKIIMRYSLTFYACFFTIYYAWNPLLFHLNFRYNLYFYYYSSM